MKKSLSVYSFTAGSVMSFKVGEITYVHNIHLQE